ncbi:Serine/threonine-protein phosphatase 6 regulatory subunit 2 [Monoraphidium neglectum]|uniref:Serine/threonine-protein phosphatase 6 regulatory subunit 2 n=1 Tax=Monoraphidium neglectum TaxID=145388 RepID=A0A0D2MRA2_9CHLO|nr:Serine/threonine-protein phosphatase 6 regulatory subunit 2 [Monoraphidium neglectum]KIZ05115.1 Serine/threonine-protein phosphatase 6 regulatory subunit 2 [Monoraphidium neglectum]|eukprot:XP_013904134.1 Serine/threonine-protein phosphatase 6 regulatory subunit 2 [Monoraphidium neglectum]
MAFWRVAGFAQPSPIEQILDKEEYTLEELLDEDDIIQECKSLNGRLIAFLREKEVVEQLLRYLVQPPSDPDDPKKQYKYPFTACEVFCCEVEAVFNTLLEDEALLGLLFSLVDAEPPLSCKAAGYFGRVVGQLLVRKPNEMMQYLSNHDELLGKLVRHLDVTSIADVIKRLAGADDQSAMVFMPMHTQWLVETPLLDMLLERLGPGWPGDAVTNAADILTAIAHTQPSALSSKLMQPVSVAALLQRALEPGGKVLVPALEVCGALLEPRNGGPGADAYAGAGSAAGSSGGSSSGDAPGSGGGASAAAAAFSAAKPRVDALSAMLVYLPQLVAFLATPGDASAVQETTYGLLSPPLGRARLKVLELLAVLLHVGDEGVEAALVASGALALAMDLFARYPFNNLLHHRVYRMFHGLLVQGGAQIVQHALATCRLAAWLAGLPAEVEPAPRPGLAPRRAPLRAGYLGHVTRIGNLLLEVAAARQPVSDALAGDEAWASFLSGDLQRRNEVEDTGCWECGRPTCAEMGDLGSDGDEFQPDMDLEQMQGMQPTLYHRYGVLDDDGDDEEEEEAPGTSAGASEGAAAAGYEGGGGDARAYGTMLAAAMQHVDLSDSGGGGLEGGGGGGGGGGEEEADEAVVLGEVREREVEAPSSGGAGAGQGTGSWSLLAHPGALGSPVAADVSGGRSMEDDAVLLTTSDDEDGASASGSESPGRSEAPPGSAPLLVESAASSGGSESVDAVAASPPSDDLVLVEPPSDDAGAAAPVEAGDTGAASASVEGSAARPVTDTAACPLAALQPPAAGANSDGQHAMNGGAELDVGAAPAAVGVASAAGGSIGVGSEPGFKEHAAWERAPLPVQVPEHA